MTVKIEVLQPFHIDPAGDNRVPVGSSVYFPAETPLTNRNDYLIEMFHDYRDNIGRVHLPPEYNLKNFEQTVNFMRFLENSLKLAGYSSKVVMDGHPGHGLGRQDMKSRLSRLNDYLSSHTSPDMYFSLENIYKTDLSSKEDIIDVSSYIKKNGLKKIAVTVDGSDLMKDSGLSVVGLAKEMRQAGVLDVLGCVHTASSKLGELERELKDLDKTIYLVNEKS